MPGSVCSFFEGTEKKFELIVDPAVASFRSFGDAYWTAVVRGAGADILSKLSSAHCDAYLLSESSLFVFDHRVAMMTCGQTILHDAVLAVLERVPLDRVRALVYKRKHEVFPHDQPTSFFDDVRVLNESLPGRAYQFGNRDEHHLYLFHTGRSSDDDPHGTTVEVLMHGLGEGVRRDFCITERATTAEVRAATGVDRIIPGFEVDDHLFRPNGYSLNAVRADEYYAIHVTPEQGCSYASFETNHRFAGNLEPVLARLLGAFRPRTWDLVLFDRGVTSPVVAPGYRLKSHVAQAPDRGPEVRFLSYYRPQRAVARAVELQVR
jgi:S-adenosylmethionine decarboxylase